jgi:5-methylcytosine-specific restriction endonuclease McrA
VKYTEQLLTINWKNKRLIILKRDNFSCRCCGSENDLQVHHKKYIVGRMAWEYPNSILITVCGECHLFIHNTRKIKSEKDKFKPKPKITTKKVVDKRKKILKQLSQKDRKLQLKWDALNKKNKSIAISKNQ